MPGSIVGGGEVDGGFVVSTEGALGGVSTCGDRSCVLDGGCRIRRGRRVGESSLGVGLGIIIGLFRPGLAWKPRLWLGLRGLQLSKSSGRAKASEKGLALAWPGFRPRLFKAVWQGLALAF